MSSTTSSEPDQDDWLHEQEEWLDALEWVQRVHGEPRVRELLERLQAQALDNYLDAPSAALNTPYRNSIPPSRQPPYPGDIDLEKRIESILRWNAMVMVLRANDAGTGVGGHIATYASAATLLEVGFNHIFRNRAEDYGGDIVNIQPHAAPGVYARAFLEGRLNKQQLENFRRELQPGGGLSSYPHPRRMPGMWPCPTASMGLSTAMSIYLARFARYLENRGLKPRNGGKIWCFIGDGEADEPEVLGTINIAARERLDNLILVINCNLQRLDGPVRGNGKIIQELERTFRGAQWKVIKLIWGGAWDPLLAADHKNKLQQRMDEALDGDYQMYSVLSGEEVRQHWVRGDKELEEIMKPLNDEEIRSISRGGHDHHKVYAAYRSALDTVGRPTVILAKTIKGYGMGSGGEGRNTAHQKKTMSTEERQECARRFGLPLTEQQIAAAELYVPDDSCRELQYLRQRRESLGGFQPSRNVDCPRLKAPSDNLMQQLFDGSDRAMSTTMVMVRLLSKLLRDDSLGPYIVPIVPDEARTFGMDGLFKQVGIYSSEGQRYRPVDSDSLLPYLESEQGQILQEGICEAGAMASFLAAGTSYSHFGVPAIPFYFFYSMFGFQRVGDLIWAGGDALCRGFLVGGTAGRTTLNGEGLQHQDGHSLLLASTVPSVISYDPAFGYEVALIVQDGIRRMYDQEEALTYYLTAYNENYAMPSLPSGVREGVLKGIYLFRESRLQDPDQPRVQLFGSGSILQQVLVAQQRLEMAGIAANAWSVTSYTELYRDAIAAENRQRESRHADDQANDQAFIRKVLENHQGPVIAVTDYMRALPELVSKWVPADFYSLGTDGFGLSESRASLRKAFQVDASSIIDCSICALRLAGALSAEHEAQAQSIISAACDAAVPADLDN